jgi:TPR repeat protein
VRPASSLTLGSLSTTQCKAQESVSAAILSVINSIQYNPRVSELNILERIRQAAKDGDPFAQFELGFSYDNGAWVEQDVQKAAEFYAKAAKQGHRTAEHNLLLQHISGQAKLHRPSVVFSKIKSIAEAGDCDAQNNLGLCFQFGYGTKQNYAQAMVWFRRAADSGLATSQFNVGGLYFEGNGVEKNLSIAIQWYTRAAEQRDELALLQLGSIYQKGLAIDVDLKRAFLLYLIAYKQGSSRAANHLGFMFKKGLGVTQDDFLAFQLYLKAVNLPDSGMTIEQNNSYQSTAYFWLGHMTEKGEGTKRNLQAAMRWYKRGAALGAPSCIAAIARLRPARKRGVKKSVH